MKNNEKETLLNQISDNEDYVERSIQALEVVNKERSELTAKQMKVYMYLVAMSYYKGGESYYRLYWNRILAKEAATFLNISQPTWRTSIKKLKDLKYIYPSLENYEHHTYDCVRIPTSYIPLGRQTLLKLLKYCPEELGGFAITVLGIFYRYWIYCEKNRIKCKITLSEITHILYSRPALEERLNVVYIVEKLNNLGLITTKYYTATNPHNNKNYVGYELLKEPNLKAIENTLISDEINAIMGEFTDCNKIANIANIKYDDIQDYLKKHNMLPKDDDTIEDIEIKAETQNIAKEYDSKIYGNVCYVFIKGTGELVNQFQI